MAGYDASSGIKFLQDAKPVEQVARRPGAVIFAHAQPVGIVIEEVGGATEQPDLPQSIV